MDNEEAYRKHIRSKFDTLANIKEETLRARDELEHYRKVYPVLQKAKEIGFTRLETELHGFFTPDDIPDIKLRMKEIYDLLQELYHAEDMLKRKYSGEEEAAKIELTLETMHEIGLSDKTVKQIIQRQTDYGEFLFVDELLKPMKLIDYLDGVGWERANQIIQKVQNYLANQFGIMIVKQD